MEPLLSPAQVQNLNTLWAKVRPRIENIETAADFLAPVPQPAPAVSDPSPQSGSYTCFESADEAIKILLADSVAREQALEHSYECLATWAPDRRASRLFQSLRARQRSLARRLSSACYLLTGRRIQPAPAPECRPANDWLPDVRTLFFAEAHAAERYRTMAADCGDPCLCELLRRAHTAKREAADALMGVLEEALGR